MIEHIFHLCKSDAEEFMRELAWEIRKMEEEGMEVEVQYQIVPKTPMLFSTLLIGRKCPKLEKGGE